MFEQIRSPIVGVVIWQFQNFINSIHIIIQFTSKLWFKYLGLQLAYNITTHADVVK